MELYPANKFIAPCTIIVDVQLSILLFRPGHTNTGAPTQTCSPQLEAFRSLVQFMKENDRTYWTAGELVQKMRSFCEDVYGARYLIKKLENDLGSIVKVVRSRNQFEDTLVYLNDSVQSILQKFYQEERAANTQEQKKRLIKLAADIIRSEINDIQHDKESYFSFKDLELDSATEFVPEALLMLLKNLSPRKAKGKDWQIVHASLGQAIVQMARPKTVIPPLQLSLGVEIHHRTGSRFLVDLLHKFGFCSHYNTVMRFQKDCIFHDMGSESDTVTPLYSADNADVNQRTIDGKNTHHMMGIIKSYREAGRVSSEDVTIKNIGASNEEIKKKIVPIKYVKKADKKSITVLLKDLSSFSSAEKIFNAVTNLDFLRVSARLTSPVPEFSGMMKLFTRNNSHPGVHKIEFLPFVDLNPSDTSTVYTTLSFVMNLCEKQDTKCVITFDQPLWQTAMILKKEHKMDSLTILLGNFHTSMIFHAAIGHIMKNTGLKEMMSCVYAGLSVDGILKGKSYERAVRAHDLVSTVLKSIVMKQV